LNLIFVGQVGRIEISLVGVEIFQIEKQALVMDKVWASVPRPDVKLDQAIARKDGRKSKALSVISAGLGVVVLGQALTVVQIAGIALVIVALIGATLSRCANGARGHESTLKTLEAK
jgi:hypothetical protein